MRAAVPVATDIVLLGAGHAHAEVLRQAAMRPVPGVRITLIAREALTPYSGMLPALIRGECSLDDAHLDCARLAAAAGARLILAEATGLDLAARRVHVSGRPALSYDLLSIDVGGQPSMPATGGVPVKPIGRFLAHLADLESRLPPDARIAVIGGGASGAELAIALAHRLRGRARLTLVSRDSPPLATAPRIVQRAVTKTLAAYDIELIPGIAQSFTDGLLRLADGQSLPVTETLWATGVVGPAFLAASGLGVDALGCIRITATLQSETHPTVFAAGDCATLAGAPRPKAGVWAVRAGAPLAENLRRAATSQPLRPWRPQRTALAILGLGTNGAVAWRGPLALSAPWVARWKRHIDRRWMAMYQALRPMPMSESDARCGGCGAKIGPDALTTALSNITPAPRPDIPIGLADADDAALTLPPPGQAVVQTVDYFRAFLDDPYVFGQVAAAHALSDVFAMGATPWTAMAIATIPFMHGRKMQDDLAAMMQGAAEILAAENCTLIGGHSAEGAEAGLGFALTGLVPPAQAWRKSGLQPGDALILTKPLGTGIILAAAMRGDARAEWLTATTTSMRQTNGPAARILHTLPITACTDITGFGLAGHLTEMLRASNLAATLTPTLPALPGAIPLASTGTASTLAPTNRAAIDLPDSPATSLLADPQTSGGLLAGTPDGPSAIAALAAAGIPAWIIGHVVAGPAGRLTLAKN